MFKRKKRLKKLMQIRKLRTMCLESDNAGIINKTLQKYEDVFFVAGSDSFVHATLKNGATIDVNIPVRLFTKEEEVLEMWKEVTKKVYIELFKEYKRSLST